MTLQIDQLRGHPLPQKPNNLSRCGMSIAKFAQHRDTKCWFKLLSHGDIIGSALQLDFYRQVNVSGHQRRLRLADQELATA